MRARRKYSSCFPEYVKLCCIGFGFLTYDMIKGGASCVHVFISLCCACRPTQSFASTSKALRIKFNFFNLVLSSMQKKNKADSVHYGQADLARLHRLSRRRLRSVLDLTGFIEQGLAAHCRMFHKKTNQLMQQEQQMSKCSDAFRRFTGASPGDLQRTKKKQSSQSNYSSIDPS